MFYAKLYYLSSFYVTLTFMTDLPERFNIRQNSLFNQELSHKIVLDIFINTSFVEGASVHFNKKRREAFYSLVCAAINCVSL